jgi:hypothetical protein
MISNYKFLFKYSTEYFIIGLKIFYNINIYIIIIILNFFNMIL